MPIANDDEPSGKVSQCLIFSWHMFRCRVVRMDTLFVLVTVCEELDVPLIPLAYLLRFFSGESIPSKHRRVLQNFFQTCLTEHKFQPLVGKTGSMNAQSNICLYTSTSCLAQRQGANVYDATESVFRFVPNTAASGNRLGIPSVDSVISTCAHKLHGKYRMRLQNGLCKANESFYYGMQSLSEDFDLRRFFGNHLASWSLSFCNHLASWSLLFCTRPFTLQLIINHNSWLLSRWMFNLVLSHCNIHSNNIFSPQVTWGFSLIRTGLCSTACEEITGLKVCATSRMPPPRVWGWILTFSTAIRYLGFSFISVSLQVTLGI
jgi:hypothetical protein